MDDPNTILKYLKFNKERYKADFHIVKIGIFGSFALDEIYAGLKKKNNMLEIHLFENGKHPAMLSNKNEFFKMIRDKIKNTP